MIDSLHEVTEKTLAAAHKAGMAFWQKNKPSDAADVSFVARSMGWRSELETAWLAGYYGAKRRDTQGGL